MFSFFVLIGVISISSLILFTYPAISLCVPLSSVIVFIGTMSVANFFAIPLNIITLMTVLTGN